MHLGKVFLRNHRKSVFRCARAGGMFACSVLPTQDSVLKLLQKTVISLRNWIALHPTYILLYLHYYSRHTKMKERAIAWLRKDFINAPYFTFHLISHISAIPFSNIIPLTTPPPLDRNMPLSRWPNRHFPKRGSLCLSDGYKRFPRAEG